MRQGRHRVFLILAAVALMALTARLGFWQLARAQQKEAAHALAQQRAYWPMVALEALAPLPFGPGDEEGQRAQAAWLAQHQHRQVQLQGQWLPQFTVFLEHRQMERRPGFHVLTPLQLASGAGVVMVQRGWVPRDFHDRSRVPVLADAAGTAVLEGVLQPPPARLLELGGAQTPSPEAGKPLQGTQIRQNIGLPEFAQETGLPLHAGFSVRQTSPAEDGLLRRWPAFDSGAAMHRGYAFQWFALCAVLLVLTVWFQMTRPLRRPPDA